MKEIREDDFDSCFKRVLRVAKEINSYKPLLKWIGYRQSYGLMKSRCEEFKQKVKKDYRFLYDFLNYTCAFKEAWIKYDYPGWKKDLEGIRNKIMANNDYSAI